MEGLNLAKAQLNDYHNIQITAPIPNPVLQAISQKNLWEKLKVLWPRGQYYAGPIYDNQGRKCTTAAEYDNAMLATREFWFTPPISGTIAWIDTLSTYQQHSQVWPTLPTPQLTDYYAQILHTKDSSPGPDGIPYAAWRVSPTVTSHILTKEFTSLVRGISPPPQQVGVWIPKAKMGLTADYFRPLGMPDTLDRLMDGTTAGILFTHTRHCFHPSQTMLNHFREPQTATLAVQAALDSTSPRAALFLDLAKAFECVNAHWILRFLFIKQAPSWVIQLAQRVFFGRSMRHKVQGRLLPPRTVHSGVDMGRSSSVFFFCLAMDPIFVYLNRIPQCVLVAGYVDDTNNCRRGAFQLQLDFANFASLLKLGLCWLSNRYAWVLAHRLLFLLPRKPKSTVNSRHSSGWNTMGYNLWLLMLRPSFPFYHKTINASHNQTRTILHSCQLAHFRYHAHSWA